MILDRRALLLGLLASAALPGCTAEEAGASDEAIAAAVYRHPGPPMIALYTMVSTQNNEGLHSGLLVSGSQRVMFDPSGSWYHPDLPERGDVHYGMTPAALNFYENYHARETVRVYIQEVEVAPEVAEKALALVKANGAVGNAFCSNSISKILVQLPGFEAVGTTMYPKKLRDSFANVPGVQTRTRWDGDPDDHKQLLGNQGAL